MINSEDIGGNRIMCVDIAARSVINASYVITQTEFECQSLSFLLCIVLQYFDWLLPSCSGSKSITC